MRAFLLAAGHGTRLRPMTDHLPKCLVPIQGIPLLAIWLKKCAALGVTEVLINLHAHVDTVRRFLLDSEKCDLRVHVSEEPELLGSAGTLLANRRWLENEELFWIFYADVLHCADLDGMLRLHRQCKPVATLGVYEVPDPSRCGVVAVNHEGVIEDFVEKPARPASNLAFTGLMIGTPKMIDVIPDHVPADIGFDVLPKLKNQMRAFHIRDYLLDIGTLENYQKAQTTWPGHREYESRRICV